MGQRRGGGRGGDEGLGIHEEAGGMQKRRELRQER